jgi:FkbM family methyltransferase
MMLRLVRNKLKDSRLVQRIYGRYIRPYLPQHELETYILRSVKFDQCVDVGAHRGTYSVLLSRQSNRVYAFEPMQYSFEKLTALRMRNVTAYKLALGCETGKMDISLPTLNNKSAFGYETLRPLAEGEYEKVDKQEVNVVKFDDLEGQIDFARIDFIKIDVEGFEMEVLLGMTRLVETRRPALMIEIEKRHNSRYLEVFGYLIGLSYEPYMTVDGIRLRRLDIDKLPTLQSTERLTRDWNGDRTFRRGDHKNYINNFFFLQSHHKPQFGVTNVRVGRRPEIKV